jgi:predicted dehydrogenase
MINVAVIGVGSMGVNHARLYADIPTVELVAVVDKNAETASRVAARYHTRFYTDYTEMLTKERPDAVTVASPTKLHAEIASAALNSGAHVLIEKPIAATIEEGQKLLEISTATGKQIMVGHIERFNPAIIELKRRLDAGELGQIFIIHSRRLSPFPKRILDVGVSLDLASHELDMMRFLTNANVKSIKSETYQVLHPTNEDIVFGLLRFDNEILGILDVNWVTPTKVREITVTGEKGMFAVNYLDQNLYFYKNAVNDVIYNKQKSSLNNGFSIQEGEMIRYQISKREPLRNEIESFIDAVHTGKAPTVDAQDGIQALSLAIQIVENG